MKRIVALLLSLVMMTSLIACAAQPEPGTTPSDHVDPTRETTTPMESTSISDEVPDDTTEPEASVDIPEETTLPPNSDEQLTESTFEVNLEGVTNLEELELRIEEHLAGAMEALRLEWETLSEEVDTYEKYCNDTQTVASFYQTIIDETEQMCILLYEYSAVYARMILDSDMSADDKYQAMDGIYDCLYDDGCEEINDEIYGGILDEMYDFFYEGILEDAKDDVNYSDWYDVCSEEYSQWYDTCSEVYGLYYDTASDIYSFYLDMGGELFGRDFERAENVYAKFLEKIEKRKGNNNDNGNTNLTFDTTLRGADNIEELETVIDAHVTECVQALYAEWEGIATTIDTFDKYMSNVDEIEEFHTHVEESAAQILAMICEYGIFYAELILESDSSTKDQYKNFEDFKNCIYEDACEIVKDEIYEDLLEEMKDYYYDGIIQDAKDDTDYGDWAEARSDAYSWWSDARGEVYGDWSDTRGDLYSFYSDIRSELYGGDREGATDELEDFKKKVEIMW